MTGPPNPAPHACTAEPFCPACLARVPADLPRIPRWADRRDHAIRVKNRARVNALNAHVARWLAEHPATTPGGPE